MWPEKVSSTVCPKGMNETMGIGISLYQVMGLILLVGMMAGIAVTLLVQALWAKVFDKHADFEVAAVEDREQEGGGVPEQVPGAPEQVPEPEPERTGDQGWDRVYVTPFGKRWHKKRQCQGLLSARRVEPITQPRAEQGGYSACRYCG